MKGNVFFFAFEPVWISRLQAHMTPWMVELCKLFSLFGEELVMVMVLGFVYFCLDKKRGSVLGACLVCALTGGAMLKNMVWRIRPYMAHQNIESLYPVDGQADLTDVSAQGYSFPSGHSLGAATLYGGLGRLCRSRGLTVLGAVIAFLVGFSRVALGNHYPTDVLAGWAMGALFVFLIPFLMKRIHRKAALYAALAALGAAGIFFCRTRDYYSSLGLMIGFLAGDLFENAFVDFPKPPSLLAGLLRLGGALAVLGTSLALWSLCFPEGFFYREAPGCRLLLTVRYAVSVFLTVGIYPLCFQKNKPPVRHS